MMRLRRRCWGWLWTVCIIVVVHLVVSVFILPRLPFSKQHDDDEVKIEVETQQNNRENTDKKDWSPIEETLDVVKSHLAVMRKELEISESKNKLSKESTGKLLFEKLRNDSEFSDTHHVENLLELASAIRKSQVKNETETSEVAGVVDEEKKVASKKVDSVPETSQPVQSNPPPETKNDNYLVKVTLTDDMLLNLSEAVNVASTNSHHHRRGKALHIHRNTNAAWQMFQNHISQYELYGARDHVVDQVLHHLATKTIVGLHEISNLGTQLKLVFKLNYGGMALFKPMRISKDAEANPNHYMYDDFERHHAEIAAFHLDRVLNFRRTPPAAGRYVNLTRDIGRFASNKLKKTFYISPSNNLCFHGICDAYCDTGHAVCGHPHVVEGSMAVWLPDPEFTKRKHWANPWAQRYSAGKKAEWELNPKYCSKVKADPIYSTGRRLLDIMDMAVFDFLTGNKDRHHYHTLDIFGNFSFILLFDNGRSFGRPHHDEIGLLAPVRQCCLIRASTLRRLINLHQGPDRLSDVMERSLNKDVLSPVLNQHHLAALDRRLAYILQELYKCGTSPKRSNGFADVIKDDGF